MITVRVGDLFASKAQTLVNTVNCVGIMGKGIALEFKRRFPEMFRDYEKRCDAREVRLGRPYLYKDLVDHWVLNFPTKDHWRSVSKLDDIVEGLAYLQAHYREWGITSLAVPPLGCGHGQLEWKVVGPTLHRYLSELDTPVELYAPHGTPADLMDEAFLAGSVANPPVFGRSLHGSRVSPAIVALVAILSRINRETYHWPIGRTTFQKIAYFATESGIPTGLQYQRGSYGPFAADLKQVISCLVNHQLVAETKRGQMFEIKPGPTYRDAREVSKPQLREWVPLIEHVADLFLRLPTTTDAEIAATVHFAAKEVAEKTDGKATEIEVVDEVMRWKQKRRPPINRNDVANTTRNLNLLGWVDLVPSSELDPADEELAYA
ncbi:MAG: macro domain-containing protein [Rhodospirillales bacterium]|nr:macro domain-containing protein [Rhodospirillales bacterium]